MSQTPPEDRASFAVLARLKQMIHEWEQDENVEHRLAKRLVLVLAVMTGMLAMSAILVPSLFTSLVRSITSVDF